MDKPCETCGRQFSRPRDYSQKQWERRRFCSAPCVRGHLKALGPKTRYRKVRNADGRTLNEHRVVMEVVLGRPLGANEHVHHKNGDREDNRPENLELIDPATHGRIHAIETRDRRRAAGLPMGRAVAKAVKRAMGYQMPARGESEPEGEVTLEGARIQSTEILPETLDEQRY